MVCGTTLYSIVFVSQFITLLKYCGINGGLKLVKFAELDSDN